MRILVLYPYVPFPLNRGTYQRTFHLLREMARVHEIDLLALAEGGTRMEHRHIFESFCSKVEFIPFDLPEWPRFTDRLLKPLPITTLRWSNPNLAAALKRMLSTERYDVVHVCDINMAQYFLKEHQDIPIVIDRSRVDLQFQLMEQRQLNLGWRNRLVRFENYSKLWFYERTIARRSSLQIVCGADDQQFIHRYIDSKLPVSVVINGADLEYFCPTCVDEERAEEPTVVFCGAMDYSPNIDGIHWYFKRIHHLLRQYVPNVRVLVVGKNPGPDVRRYDAMPEVTVTGSVKDVRPHYRKAWLQIAPLRIGGGTRLKIIESIAMGTPVVSTTVGAQGLGLCHDNEVLLADTPREFAEQTARALKDAHLRKGLQRAGLEAVCSRLSWQTIGRDLNAIYARHFSTSATPKNPARMTR
ncbi:MAG: glycosyltransferase [Verrucomicrobia bacterium]|nr:glycosyltransferase [Verrucomicrobiota bacterium]